VYNNPIYKFLKRQFKHVIHTIGFDVLSYNIFTSQDIQLQTLLRTYNINTVLDVGANEGQYAKHLIELGYKGSIYSFEPMAAVYARLRANAEGCAQWRTINAGIGKEEGELMLNVSENLASSSLLKVEMKSIEVDSTTRTTHQENIKITTIDTFIRSNPPFGNNILLKLDVQGYEMEALKGSMKSIGAMTVVQVELSFVPVYENGPLYVDVINFMKEQGFELFTLLPAFVDGKTGRMLQADGIFVRTNFNPDRIQA